MLQQRTLVMMTMVMTSCQGPPQTYIETDLPNSAPADAAPDDAAPVVDEPPVDSGVGDGDPLEFNYEPAGELISPARGFLDLFGVAVVANDAGVVVGARGHNDGRGVVFLFHYQRGDWELADTVRPDQSLAREDFFGWSVDRVGDLLVVGAPGDDENGDDSGAVYLFRRQNDVWIETAKLLSGKDEYPNEYFGFDIDLHQNGELLVVGGRNSSRDGERAGSAHIFEYNGLDWDHTAVLSLESPEEYDAFGHSVLATTSTQVIVGAPGRESRKGAAFVFCKNEDKWQQCQELKLLDDAEDAQFGSALDADGDILAVGAMTDLVEGMPTGSAYILRQSPLGWRYSGRATPRNSEILGLDMFGLSLAVAGRTIVVGAMWDSETGWQAGAAYAFHLDDAGNLSQGKKLMADHEQPQARFGRSIALHARSLFIGAHYTRNDDNPTGSVYIFADSIEHNENSEQRNGI